MPSRPICGIAIPAHRETAPEGQSIGLMIRALEEEDRCATAGPVP